jgi:hypothetical protein
MSNTASSSSLGASQQTPNDAANLPNEIAFAVERMLARLDIAKPVKVVAVNSGAGSPPGPCTVDVQPLVSQVDGNGNAVEQGTVYGIPVARLQGGPWTIVCDPVVGQFGFVVCADRDISKVVASPGVAPPNSSRRSSISDGVFVGSILNDIGEQYLWLRADGTFKLAAAGGFVLESDASGNATMTTGSGGLTVNGPINSTGQITANSNNPATKVTLTNHRHSANNQPPTPGF